jgi:RNA polymerase I-specific transcription initiation factor RRN7
MKAKVNESAPNLLDTLSLCYIAVLFLRIPMTTADMHQWVNEGELPYYHASHKVPSGMVERLPAEYQRLLEPQDLLQPERLHSNTFNMAVMFNTDFDMGLPGLNVPLLLYRWTRALVLPLEVFAGSQRLSKLINLDMSSLTASKASRLVILRYQEAQLMALVIVASKLLFPFDDIERKVYQPTDLSSLSLNWSAWIDLHHKDERNSETDDELTFEQAFDFDQSDCLAAADGKLDAYLDWYEDNIASDEIREHGRARQDAEFRRTLFQMFPKPFRNTALTDKASNTAVNTVWDELLKSKDAIQNQGVAQPALSRNVNRYGSFYRRFRTVEELSGPARLLLEKAASLAGISLENMVQAVFATEKKLEKVEERLRKAHKASAVH